jgi:glucose-6-phosphate 1-dehydrogenase
MEAAAALVARPSLADEPPPENVSWLSRETVAPTTLVLFGSSGDLVRRKLLPSLCSLEQGGVLTDDFTVVGVSRRGYTDAEFRGIVHESIDASDRADADRDAVERLLARTHHVTLEFDAPEGYERLRERLDELEAGRDRPPNRCFYLSTASSFFPTIASALRRHGLAERPGATTRVVMEKPFGHDLASALTLAEQLDAAFDESQLFRVDHYIAKETVQNILALRFANSMFEPIWNRTHVDHIQITAAEDLGVGTRAGFYEQTGALRDLVQNHLLQLLALVCMETPASLAADAIRDAKVDLLRSIVPLSPADAVHRTVRAQYMAGVIHDRHVRGYHGEDGVAPDSQTETYAATRFEIDNDRWRGVPIYVRTGKRLARKLTEVAVQFKPPQHIAAGALDFAGVPANQLVLALEPGAGVSIRVGAKEVGTHGRIRPIEMAYRYGPSFAHESPAAYDRLLLDAIAGNATLFTRGDEVAAQWAIVDPILQAWSAGEVPLCSYAAGSQGPAPADELIAAPGGRAWRPID